MDWSLRILPILLRNFGNSHLYTPMIANFFSHSHIFMDAHTQLHRELHHHDFELVVYLIIIMLLGILWQPVEICVFPCLPESDSG